MDELLQEPPWGVTVKTEFDGIRLTWPGVIPSVTLRRRRLMVGAAGLVALPTLLGVVVSPSLFVSLLLGLLLLALSVGARWALRRAPDGGAFLGEHGLTLDGREIPMTGIRFPIAGEEPVLVLTSGEQLPVAATASETIRPWVGRLVYQAVTQQQQGTGSRQDVPAELRALQRTPESS